MNRTVSSIIVCKENSTKQPIRKQKMLTLFIRSVIADKNVNVQMQILWKFLLKIN